MKRKILSIFLCSLMLAGGICGCGHDDDSNINSDSSSQVVHVDGTFDIEEVRKNINIKGYHFEVPMKLKDLEKGLKYEFVGEEFDDGLYKVVISDDNELILESLAADVHKISKKAYLYNIAVTDSNSDVAGIVPFVSTKEDVLEKFGKPDYIENYDILGDEKETYKYGLFGQNDGFKSKGKFMNIGFNSSDVIEAIVVNYLE